MRLAAPSVLALFVALVACLVGVTAACSGKNGGGADPSAVAPEPSSDGGGDDAPDPLDWDPDTGVARCGVPQSTAAASCRISSDAGDAQPPADGAAPADDAGPEEPGSAYGDPVVGTESDDDQCKYHVRWTSTPLVVGQPVTFTLDGTTLADQTPMTGGAPRIEAFLDDTHVLAAAGQRATEPSPGHYTVGAITFDVPGTWTVRLHFFDACTDEAPDSPIGHVAFLVDVK